MKVTFGIPSLLKDTPAFATWIFRVVLYLAMGTSFVVLTFTEIPPHMQIVIARVCAEVVMTVHGLTRMFGIEVKTPTDPNEQPKK
jgi:hypothetical protein